MISSFICIITISARLYFFCFNCSLARFVFSVLFIFCCMKQPQFGMGQFGDAVSAMKCEMRFPLECQQSAKVRTVVVWETCKRKSQSSTCPRQARTQGGCMGCPPGPKEVLTWHLISLKIIAKIFLYCTLVNH